jgi:hypothetical protein
VSPEPATKRHPKTIVDLMRGRFSAFFQGASWQGWILVAAAVFGLAYGLSADDEAFLLKILGRKTLPTRPASELWAVVGRRAGKSRFAAWLAVFLACFRDYSRILSPGERGIGMVICPGMRQARVAFRYISAFFDTDPMLRAMVESKTADSIHLTNGISIEVHAASYKVVRGYTVVFAIVDEAAFLPTDDSATPDTELLAALRPAMATVPGALLMVLSSPYAQRGELWAAWKGHYGHDDDLVLVIQADTQTLNPTVPASVIEKAYQADPLSASAEYGAQFRSDLEAFVGHDVLEAGVAPGRGDLPRQAGLTYVAFVDPAGGSYGGDSMALAVAHRQFEPGRDEAIVVIDVLREVKPKFIPDEVCAEFADLLRGYGIRRVSGDRYAGTWPEERFKAHGIAYQPIEMPKSELYTRLLPLLMARRVELPDHERLIGQLASLERRTARGGKDSIDHPRGQHDDLANVIAGVAQLASARPTAAVATVRSDYGQPQASSYLARARAARQAARLAELRALEEAPRVPALGPAQDWAAVRESLRQNTKEQ